MLIDISHTEPWVLPIPVTPHSHGVTGIDWLLDLVCPPRADVRKEFTERHFVFRDRPRRQSLRRILAQSAELLNVVPSLETAVWRAVDEVVLLKARPAYDISHSEPRWPRTIFVSVPTPLTQVSALRAAENVVHEAMHLQLTIFECICPLVSDADAKMTSPWRKEARHLQGVLHGFYVFRCIESFFAVLNSGHILEVDGTNHVRRRLVQIAEELTSIDLHRLARGMTPEGRIFLSLMTGKPISEAQCSP